MWTHFWDMHSGGGLKEPPYHHIFIEQNKHEAMLVFQNRFGHNPERVSCTCCGEDYLIDECQTLEHATAYQRGCKFINDRTEPGLGHYVEGPSDERLAKTYTPLDQYLSHADVLVIRANEIKPDEMRVALKEQGYVWHD